MNEHIHDDFYQFDSDDDSWDDEDGERKEQLTAFLLAFFLGNLGAGRFYAGYIGMGVCKLLLGMVSCCACFCSCGCMLYTIATSNESPRNQSSSYATYNNISTEVFKCDCDDFGDCCRSCCAIFLVILGVLAFLTQSIWWFTDVILFGMNDIPEYGGPPLEPW